MNNDPHDFWIRAVRIGPDNSVVEHGQEYHMRLRQKNGMITLSFQNERQPLTYVDLLQLFTSWNEIRITEPPNT